MTIDHRAEAERWLAKAASTKPDNNSSYDKLPSLRQMEALIGIGHALLARLPEEPSSPDIATEVRL